MRSQPKACGPCSRALCQSCGRAVRAAHLFVLLTSLSQLLHSAVKLVLYCLALHLQHVQSSRCAILALLCPVRMTSAAGCHMLQATLLSTGLQSSGYWMLLAAGP